MFGCLYSFSVCVFRAFVPHGCFRVCVCCVAFVVFFLLVVRLYAFSNSFCLLWFPRSSSVGLVCVVCACLVVVLNSLNVFLLVGCCLYICLHVVRVFSFCLLSLFRLMCVMLFGVVVCVESCFCLVVCDACCLLYI